MIWLALAAAGGTGAVCRFVVDGRIRRVTAAQGSPRDAGAMPLGTLVVNTSACLLMGLLVGILEGVSAAPAGAPLAGPMSTVLGVGLLGGYSTFSTAAVEGARLLLAGRWTAAVLHAGLMTLAALLASVAGLMLGSPLGAALAAAQGAGPW